MEEQGAALILTKFVKHAVQVKLLMKSENLNAKVARSITRSAIAFKTGNRLVGKVYRKGIQVEVSNIYVSAYLTSLFTDYQWRSRRSTGFCGEGV
jgi:hypothetical protein